MFQKKIYNCATGQERGVRYRTKRLVDLYFVFLLFALENEPMKSTTANDKVVNCTTLVQSNLLHPTRDNFRSHPRFYLTSTLPNRE